MLNPFFSLCVYLTEMVISYAFFSSQCKPKMKNARIIAIGSAFFAMGSAINILLGNNGVVNGLATLVINAAFARLCFACTLRKSVFYACILGVLNTALEVAVISISSFAVGTSFSASGGNFPLLLFQAITIKTLYFFIVLVLSRMIRPGDTENTLPPKFLVFPILTMVCQFLFWYICACLDTGYEVQLLLSIASGCLFIATVLLFFIYSHQVKKERQTMQIQSELSRLQTEQSYYQILEQQNQQLKIYAHDAKKHLAAIQALNENPAVGSYVTKLSDQLKDYSHGCNSGNKFLDVMLHKYDIDCKMRGIFFDYDVKDCNLSQLEEIELVAILGNLLDNAITAAEASFGKSVSLSTVYRNRYSVIVVTNSCDTAPKQTGNHLISTKSGFHGFGMKSVAKSIQKYDGDYEWDYDGEGHLFTVTVMVSAASRGE